ncbi:hypothetical protein IQ219_02460 [Synechocystis sp. LEGE 06083]|uniref:hypothetical protein n=1 Tax=Synechocystis sp. LEGE 06083 TaxID=915336 RepID=UPI00187FEEAC|nr:hypothetical protein [Synechocystis sp. LEGE 06083]MBE9194211.1 hypothetical protein [Synechocystis sp. LEGE 06083]
MESAKYLSNLIHEYRQNAFHGGFPDDEAIGKHIQQQTLQDPNAPDFAKFLCSQGLKGGAGIAAMARVWEFQDEIVAYQKQHKISSVYWRELDWKGEKIRFPIASLDLALMPQDGAILSRWKYPTIDKFVDFVARHELQPYLYRQDYEEDGEIETPVTLPEVYAAARKLHHASLSGWEERPVYLSKETATPGVFKTSQEICYHLTEYSLWIDNLRTDKDPDPDGVQFVVKIRR